MSGAGATAAGGSLRRCEGGEVAGKGVHVTASTAGAMTGGWLGGAAWVGGWLCGAGKGSVWIGGWLGGAGGGAE